MNFKYLILIVSLALVGCQAAYTSCPPIVPYSEQEQDKASIELQASKDRGDEMLPLMINDYHRERQWLRDCRGE